MNGWQLSALGTFQSSPPTTPTVTISSVFIGQADGNALKAILPAPANVTARLTVPAPLQRDGDLDSDIVFHEYGHGLTWRMIGRMSGPMSGAIGEGMSDTLAMTASSTDMTLDVAVIAWASSSCVRTVKSGSRLRCRPFNTVVMLSCVFASSRRRAISGGSCRLGAFFTSVP